MDTLISTFHIDIKLLIAQIVNFGIVFFVLYYFILRPLMGVMKDRTRTIEKSLADAKAMEKRMEQTKLEGDKIMADSRKEAALVLQRVAAEADIKRKESIVRAKEEIGQIINQEKARMQEEKLKTLKEIRKEAADLIILAAEKILGEKVDAKKDKEIIRKLLGNK